MKIGAVVCEYNPFHNGHEYHIKSMRNRGTSHVVAIMSADFVQRGEAAIFSKRARTKMALLNGADLVLELPSAYSMSTAEKFAQSAVWIANAIGCIEVISFGCESDNLDLLYKICDFLATDAYSAELKSKLSTGISFAKARGEVVKDNLGTVCCELLKKPNNILAIEYIRAIKKMSMNAEIFAVARKGALHDSGETQGGFASASHIRALIRSKDSAYKNFVPCSVVEVMQEEIEKKRAPADLNKIERAILCSLRKMSLDEFKKIPDVSEGLENKIFTEIKKAVTLNDLIDGVKSKRYTHARIRRIIINAFLGIQVEDIPAFPPYIRVLGINEKGKQILSVAKEKATLPIISKTSQLMNCSEIIRKTFKKQSDCTNLYSMCFPVPGVCQEDYNSKLIIL